MDEFLEGSRDPSFHPSFRILEGSHDHSFYPSFKFGMVLEGSFEGSHDHSFHPSFTLQTLLYTNSFAYFVI